MNQHIKFKLILQCTEVNREENRLSTQQAQVSIYTPHPETWPGHDLSVKHQFL